MADNDEKKPPGERLEDAVDEALYRVQNTIYGERNNINEDIPATMEDTGGFRRVNKFATRRNIGRKLLKNPKILLAAVGVIIAVIAIIALIK